MFKFFDLYYVYLLYYDILNFIINHMLHYKTLSLSTIDGSTEILINYTNKLIKSKLENTLLTIGIINIICGLLLFNIVVVYHKGEQFFRNNLNKIILIVSVLIYFLCLYLNIYYL